MAYIKKMRPGPVRSSLILSNYFELEMYPVRKVLSNGVKDYLEIFPFMILSASSQSSIE